MPADHSTTSTRVEARVEGAGNTATSAPTAEPANPRPARAGDNAPPPKRIPYAKLHTLPAPIRTFPLPTFYPNNPVSLLHIAYVWLSQTILPPPKEPSVIHEGLWDPGSRSVHVVNPKSVRALWEQGFYGKGNLSRSEPEWLKREQIRRGSAGGLVSAQVTASRRDVRRSAKWERAKAEQEVIERMRLEESQPVTSNSDGLLSGPQTAWRPPVGPNELLLLPNSTADLLARQAMTAPAPSLNGISSLEEIPVSGNQPNGGRMVNGLSHFIQDLNGVAAHGNHSPAKMNGTATSVNGTAHNGAESIIGEDASSYFSVTNGSSNIVSEKENGTQQLKRRKSVRFSPRVESTTFQHSDPPSPNHTALSSRTLPGPALADTKTPGSGAAVSDAVTETVPEASVNVAEIQDIEHLQLSPEEAFFLAFAFGALSVVDPATQKPIPTSELLKLFRSYSYFPPRTLAAKEPNLQPDDPFLIHYTVYHHFRSLGWVPRHGIKFGVDWLLYLRGPAFDHAEFGIIVIPSFTHPQWEEHEHEEPSKSWAWLMGINRVLSHVFKSLVLVYVDIPPPPLFDEMVNGPNGGITAALKKYKIREIMVRRWSANRNR